MGRPSTIDAPRAQTLVAQIFERSIVPTLIEYIKIPNKSPDFDPEWESHGHMRKAMDLIVAWCEQNRLDGMRQGWMWP